MEYMNKDSVKKGIPLSFEINEDKDKLEINTYLPATFVAKTDGDTLIKECSEFGCDTQAEYEDIGPYLGT